MDSDAAAYITAVETADNQALEEKVKIAIDNFVLGCKADGIWSAIKASCILAGARTLAGALVPLVGTAPTNYNFVSGDYNRETGLVGDGSTKYLDSNRNVSADPQNSYSFSVFVQTAGTPSNSTQLYLDGSSAAGGTSMGIFNSALFSRNRSTTFTPFGSPSTVGFFGTSRSSSAQYIARHAGTDSVIAVASQTPANSTTMLFGEAASSSFRSNARFSFYHIGESLDLAALDTRVSALITAIGAAIP